MRAFLGFIFVVAASVSVVAQTSPPSQPTVQLPVGVPTIPNDLMFSLGQQSSQLAGISTRLDKLDVKFDGIQSNLGTRMEEMQRDVTKLNVYSWIIGVVLLSVLLPMVHGIAIPWLRQRLGIGEK